jgi:hypothetical protein
VFSGRVNEKVLEINEKCSPSVKKEHLERSPNTGERGGPSTGVPSDPPILPKSGTQSTFNPDLEAPILPKSGTQSTFNPDLNVPKSDDQSTLDTSKNTTPGNTKDSLEEPSNSKSFIEELFDNF